MTLDLRAEELMATHGRAGVKVYVISKKKSLGLERRLSDGYEYLAALPED